MPPNANNHVAAKAKAAAPPPAATAIQTAPPAALTLPNLPAYPSNPTPAEQKKFAEKLCAKYPLLVADGGHAHLRCTACEVTVPLRNVADHLAGKKHIAAASHAAAEREKHHFHAAPLLAVSGSKSKGPYQSVPQQQQKPFSHQTHQQPQRQPQPRRVLINRQPYKFTPLPNAPTAAHAPATAASEPGLPPPPPPTKRSHADAREAARLLGPVITYTIKTPFEVFCTLCKVRMSGHDAHEHVRGKGHVERLAESRAREHVSYQQTCSRVEKALKAALVDDKARDVIDCTAATKSARDEGWDNTSGPLTEGRARTLPASRDVPFPRHYNGLFARKFPTQSELKASRFDLYTFAKKEISSAVEGYDPLAPLCPITEMGMPFEVLCESLKCLYTKGLFIEEAGASIELSGYNKCGALAAAEAGDGSGGVAVARQQPNRPLYVVAMPGVSENRPSVLRGDRLVVRCDPIPGHAPPRATRVMPPPPPPQYLRGAARCTTRGGFGDVLGGGYVVYNGGDGPMSGAYGHYYQQQQQHHDQRQQHQSNFGHGHYSQYPQQQQQNGYVCGGGYGQHFQQQNGYSIGGYQPATAQAFSPSSSSSHSSPKSFETSIMFVNDDAIVFALPDDFESFREGYHYSIIFQRSRTQEKRLYRAIRDIPNEAMLLQETCVRTSTSTNRCTYVPIFPLVSSPSAPPSWRAGEDGLGTEGRKVLNEEQQEFISHVNGPHRLSVLWGPPGTGKTTTLVATIADALLRARQCGPTKADDVRILVCAPSNEAADLLAERIISHPSLQLIIAEAASPRDFLLRPMARSRDPKSTPQVLAPHCPVITSDGYSLPTYADIVRARVVVSTIMAADGILDAGVDESHFTHLFVDEAGHSTEQLMLIALNAVAGGRAKVVLAGDHKQLGPHVKVRAIIEARLHYSPLLRIYYDKDFWSVVGRQLMTCYRSHPSIVRLVNASYDDTLRAVVGPSNAFARLWETDLLKELWRLHTARERARALKGRRADVVLPSGGQQLPLVAPEAPILFINHANKESKEKDSPSWMNKAEVELVGKLVLTLLEKGLVRDLSEVVVISPYRKQVSKIRGYLYDRMRADPKLEKLLVTTDPVTGQPLRSPVVPVKIATVDSFQGREGRVVIVSSVRSNTAAVNESHFGLGFLSQPERVNVALSRAKDMLILLGNRRLLANDPLWEEYLKRMDAMGRGVVLNIGGDADVDDDDDDMAAVSSNSDAAEAVCLKGNAAPAAAEEEASGDDNDNDDSDTAVVEEQIGMASRYDV